MVLRLVLNNEGVNRWGHGTLNVPKPPEGATLFVANGC
jgi:hypothetical protein